MMKSNTTSIPHTQTSLLIVTTSNTKSSVSHAHENPQLRRYPIDRPHDKQTLLSLIVSAPNHSGTRL